MRENYNKIFKGEKANTEGVRGSRENNIGVDEGTTEEIVTSTSKPKKYRVTGCTNLNLREQPTKDGNVICTIKVGEILQVENITDGWAHVYTIAGAEGYVMEEFIKEV